MPARLSDDETGEVVDRVLQWYASAARDLPWRSPQCSAWGVLVSEIMLQQTPVARVLGPWHAWMQRWPRPADLAASPSGEAVRAWGRLGYPRRALRLHAAASAIVAEHGGSVPEDYSALVALPGIGDYTAAAVASFAHGRRHVVLDVNVRRVLARVATGQAHPAPAVRAGERRLAEAFLPTDPARATRWSAAVMELGAVVCTSRGPRCQECPVRDLCRWFAAGRPAGDHQPRTQSYEGTDRQCRGVILAQLRDSTVPVATADLRAHWPADRSTAPDQFDRALASLHADGLATESSPGWWVLPAN